MTAEKNNGLWPILTGNAAAQATQQELVHVD